RAVYGPQKGASPEDVVVLDSALAHFAKVVQRDLGVAAAEQRGTGAAGGLSYGLVVGCGARITRGFQQLSELLGLDALLREVDWVLTGEGRLDAQTLSGKGPLELARQAAAHGKPGVAFAGKTEPGALKGALPRAATVQVSPPGWSEADPASRAGAAELVTAAVETWAAQRRSES